MLFFYEMIPQAEGNQCMPSIYKPSSAYYADITTVTHWKHSRSCTWARLLSDAFILKIRTGCKCFFSSLHGPPVLFSLLLCQAGFGKGSPHRPIDWLTVSNRSRSRFFSRTRHDDGGQKPASVCRCSGCADDGDVTARTESACLGLTLSVWRGKRKRCVQTSPPL